MKTRTAKEPMSNGIIIRLKDKKWLENQRVAGKVAAEAIQLLKKEVENNTVKSMLELDKLAEAYIRDNNCLPTFLNYMGFPNSVCISINRQLVHGICTDYKLQDGDLVSFDLGATYNGAIGDTAVTMIYGKPKSDRHVELVKATEEALTKAIESIQIGKRIGIIGQTIYKCAKEHGLSVVDKYGGHGLDTAEDGTGIPHTAPFVPNKSTENEGVRIQPGMILAIEPLFVIGSSNRAITSSDGWTVVCDDLCSHHEHTLYVHDDHVEVVTQINGD